MCIVCCLSCVLLCVHTQQLSTPPQPLRSSTFSRIMEEPEQQPTPPVRRKRDKPIKLPKKKSEAQNSSSDGDTGNTSSDSSPVVNGVPKQEVTSSSDSSPLVNKTVKQEVASSGDDSQLVVKIGKTSGDEQEVTSGDSPLVNKTKLKVTSSSDSNLLANKTTTQEVTSSDSAMASTTKQEMTSSDSPVVSATKQEVTSSDGPIVNSTKQEVASSDDSKQEVSDNLHTNTEQDVTKQTTSMENPTMMEPEKISIGEASSFVEEVLKQFETSKVTTSDYYSSTDLRYNEEADAPTAATTSTVTPVASEGTSAMIAKMKARGHARAQSAPLILEEEEAVVSDNKNKEQATTTVDIVNVTPSHSKAVTNKESKPAPPIVVHYLGPLVLRKEVESLLIREGVSYLERQDFPTQSPTVYWNLVSIQKHNVLILSTYLIRFGTSQDLDCHLTCHV